jgi:hypothetical protein
MTRLQAIGIGLAATGGALLLAVLLGLYLYPTLFGAGLTMKVIARAGFVGIVGLCLILAGLRILSNGRTI